MGLATIDRHSHEAHTKLYKIPKCDIIDLIASKIQPFENVKITKCPDDPTFLCNVDVFKWLYLSENWPD